MASGCRRDNKLPSFSKKRENVTPRPASFRRVSGKFLIHDKAFDYFTFPQDYVQLKGNARFTFSFLCKGNHKRKWICHFLRRKYVKNTTISVRQLWGILTGQFHRRRMHGGISCWEKWFARFGRCLWNSTCFSLITEVVFKGMEGLCMLLRRLAHPCRYSVMIQRFARLVPEISVMTIVVGDWINNEHGYHLNDFNQPFLSRASLRTYADTSHQKGAALNNCWDFVDGTVRPLCRPLQNQRIVYNGHKRVHALKLQFIVTPNGLVWPSRWV